MYLANEGHDYGPAKRAGAYAFLGRHLGLKLGRMRNPNGDFDESVVTLESREALLAHPGQPPVLTADAATTVP